MQSGIHGWGLIARTEMKQDSMVVEYRGDLLRPKMSEDRQKFYNRIGKDCYLFNVNDDIIVDATMTGAIGRFTVRDRESILHAFTCCIAAASLYQIAMHLHSRPDSGSSVMLCVMYIVCWLRPAHAEMCVRILHAMASVRTMLCTYCSSHWSLGLKE